MIKRTVFLLAAATLALSAAALASAMDVQGPATLTGHGPVWGKLRSAEGQARVRFELSGKILVAGKADDLEVSCTGENVKSRSHTNRRGLELVRCLGRRMTVVVSASRFGFHARTRRYLIDIPAGVSGKIHGRFGDQQRPQRPAAERPADDEPADEPAEAPAQ